MTWTEERIEQLKALWKEGLSCSQIAAELGNGISRVAVSGKAWRLGLAERGRRFAHPSKISRQRRTNAPVAVVRAARSIAAPSIPLPPPAPCVDVQPRYLTILELTTRLCRWPLGDGPFTYCGHDVETGRPYCEAHCVTAYPAFVPPRCRRVA